MHISSEMLIVANVSCLSQSRYGGPRNDTLPPSMLSNVKWAKEGRAQNTVLFC